MLKVMSVTEDSKTGPIAATYRSGNTGVYGSCPASCPLMPEQGKGANEIDQKYLAALKKAVPPRGKSWTYSHFPADQIGKWKKGETVINSSQDSIDGAVQTFKNGYPTVYAAPKSYGEPKVTRHDEIRFITCPASLNNSVTCQRCGGGDPLCARAQRDYVIVFPAHGGAAGRVGGENGRGKGGCYGSTGHMMNAWLYTLQRRVSKVSRIINEMADPRELVRWAKGLAAGSLLRHHILGDCGKV